MHILRRALGGIGRVFKKTGYLLKAIPYAMVLGIIEIVGTQRGRRVLAGLALVGGVAALVVARPVRGIAQGEVGVRVNQLTGGVDQLGEGWALVVPGVHRLRVYPLRDQTYRPARSARARGDAPFQTAEGLSIGIDVSVRYALEPARILRVARGLPEDVARELVEPAVDAVLYRTFAQHTVREIFSTRRTDIARALEAELGPILAADGILVRSVSIGSVDLPTEYRAGLEGLLQEELSAEKMRYTLELKTQEVKQAGLEADAEKIRREKAAEAAGQEQIIGAKAQAEAMRHVLPLKEKEIEQRRLEAEAAKIARVTAAQGEAEARRIEAGGEADGRKQLADAEAYRLDVTGKASAQQMAREGEIIGKNPLLIQKTVADKLSDKVQVIIAPPQVGGFFASGIIGPTPGAQPQAEVE
jgi:regulator of protease activity HflC (stomatin/prohibitin superfamily)